MNSPAAFGGRTVESATACIGIASALAPALEQAQVEVAVAFFASGAAGLNGTTTQSVVPLKRFDERDPRIEALAEAGGTYSPWGGTPMLRPARWAEGELMRARYATRRVTIWLCDGGPDEGTAVHAYVTRPEAPCEHVGIGLGGCDLSGTFGAARSASVANMADLPEALMRVLIPS